MVLSERRLNFRRHIGIDLPLVQLLFLTVSIIPAAFILNEPHTRTGTLACFHRLTVNDLLRQGDIYSQCFQFFGLRENPFDTRQDPAWLLVNDAARRALNELANGIWAGRSLLLLTGEVGTGKTTLLRCLRQWLAGHRIPTAFIFNPHLQPNELFEWMLVDFGVSSNARLAENPRQRLNQWLIKQHRPGVNPTLIIDEAQGLSYQTLEEVRLLLNHETLSKKLLQIVLCGQPELSDTLRRPEMRQIRQRIEVRSQTSALDRHDVHAYIQARLGIASPGGAVFAPEAIDAIHLYSRGILRVVNLLCEHTMLRASTRKSHLVSRDVVDEVARDLGYDELKPVIGPRSTPDSKFHIPAMVVSPRAEELEHSAAPVVTSAETATSDLDTSFVFASDGSDSVTESLDAPSTSPAKEKPWTRIEVAATGAGSKLQFSAKAAATVVTPPTQRASRFAQRSITAGKYSWNILSWLSSRLRMVCRSIRSAANRPKLEERVAALLEWMNKPMFAAEAKVRCEIRRSTPASSSRGECGRRRENTTS